VTRFLEVADAEVVSDTHRQAVGKQISHAQRETRATWLSVPPVTPATTATS